MAHDVDAPIGPSCGQDRPPDDCELLRRYAADADEQAFALCVRRHVDFVYSTALRRLGGDGHAAADVSQLVFTALARNARQLAPDVVLPAWLHETTRRLVANHVRTEQSRRAREQKAYMLDELNAAASPTVQWEQLRPMLDDVIDELEPRDRAAVILRFFSRRSFADIGVEIRANEDAARMRVDRALDKLRASLNRRGIASTPAALGALLLDHGVVAAPTGLSAAATSAALSGSGATGGFITFVTMNKLQIALAAVALTGGTASWLWHARATEPMSVEPAIRVEKSRVSSTLTRTDVAPAPAITSQPRAVAATGQADSRSAPGTDPSAQIDHRVRLLDSLVRLTDEQRKCAGDLFRKEIAALSAFATDEERMKQGMEIRQGTRAQLHAMLTPEQRKIYEVSPQSSGGGLPVDPANLAARLGQEVGLDANQTQHAQGIIWDEVMNQVAAASPDALLSGFRWNNAVRDRLRAILTPAQQATFDATPPYRKTGS